jgi:gas vesicle protein
MNKAAGLVVGVMIGAVVGTGLALIYAPQSGSDTRKKIRKQAGEMRNRADDFIADIKAKDEEFCKAVKEGAENYRHEMLSKMG